MIKACIDLHINHKGMIAENKKREDEGLAQAYGNDQFVYMAEQMREIANMHDDQVMGV